MNRPERSHSSNHKAPGHVGDHCSRPLPLGHNPLQRGPEGGMVVPAAVEATIEISLTPRYRVGHESVINQPENSDLGHRGHARAFDRQIAGMGGFSVDLINSKEAVRNSQLPSRTILYARS